MHTIRDCVTIALDMDLEPPLVVAVAAAQAEGGRKPREIGELLQIAPELVASIVDALRPVGRKPARPKTKTRIKENWCPSDEDRAYARKLGFGDHLIDRMARNFLDYYLMKGTAWLRWELVWQQWARNEAQKQRITPPASGAPQGDDVWRNAMRAWTERRSWPHSLGPEPGRPGCKVPAHLLQEQRSLL